MLLLLVLFLQVASIHASPDPDLENLNNRLLETERKISILQKTNEDRLLETERKISILQNTNEDLANKYSSLLNQYQQLKQKLDIHNKSPAKATGNDGKTIAKNETDRSKRLLLPVSSRVAFHASLQTDLENPGDNQHVEFGHIWINEGGDYDGSRGTFICSVPGTYVFFVTTLAPPGKWIQTEIVRNGNHLAYIYSFNDNHFGPGSNLVVVQLQSQDAVWVRIAGNWHGTGDVLTAEHSAFSGYILWESQ